MIEFTRILVEGFCSIGNTLDLQLNTKGITVIPLVLSCKSRVLPILQNPSTNILVNSIILTFFYYIQ